MLKGKNKTYKIIGICLSAINNESTRDIVLAVCDHAKKHGFKVLIFNSFRDLYDNDDYAMGEASVFELVNPSILDALVILPETIKNMETSRKIVDKVKVAGVPVISIDSEMEDCINVSFNYADVFEQIVRHIVEFHGCRTVNFMAGFKGNEFSEERLECYKRVLRENGIEIDERRIGYGDFWDTPTIREMDTFMASGLPMPEAIICANDSMAIAVCRYLREHGYNVPGDVLVTGFDGIELEKYNTPRLTTAATNVDLIGKTVVDTVERLINKEAVEKRYSIPYNMRISQSCGCHKVDLEKVSDRIMEMYNSIHYSYGHEDFMFSYIAKTMSCRTIEELSGVMAEFSDYDCWCCLNTDFLSTVREEERYHGCFTKNMNVMLHRAGDFHESNIIFPTEELVSDLENVLERLPLLLFCPLHFNEEVIGYIAIAFHLEGFPFENTRRFLINTNQIFENFKNRKMLENANAEMAVMHITDSMTGLYNRRGFYKNADKLIKTADSGAGQLVLFSVDMDDLKFINDTYGHTEGDRALKAVSRALLELASPGEICARFGGDEFVVLACRNEPEKYVDSFTESISRMLNEFSRENDLPYRLHVSVGAVTMSVSSKDELEEYMKAADKKMYEQKRLYKASRA